MLESEEDGQLICEESASCNPSIVEREDTVSDVGDGDESVRVVEPTGTSWPAAVFLIVNAALGAGVLNFPRAYHEAGGVVVSLCVQAVLMAPIVGSLVSLGSCSDHSRSSTYQDTVLGLLGPAALHICSATVVVYCFGTCITFLIIVRDQLDVIFSSLVGPEFCHTWYMNSAFTMPCTSFLLILPLCFSRRIDFLKYSSMVGVLAIFYLDGLIVYQYLYGGFEPGPVRHGPAVWTDIFLVMPTICFGYQCHVSVVPIYSCLRRRSVSNLARSVLVAITVCVLTYSVAGTFGYLTFGDRVSSDVLMAYNARDPAVLVGLVAVTLKTVSTYPLLLFCGREAVDSLFHAACGTAEPQTGSVWRRVAIGSSWFLVTVVLAAALPNIGVVIQFLGVLAALFIFVFPGLCMVAMVIIKDNQLISREHRCMTGLAVALVGIGAFIFGVVLTQVIEDNINHHSSPVIELCHRKNLLSYRPLLV